MSAANLVRSDSWCPSRGPETPGAGRGGVRKFEGAPGWGEWAYTYYFKVVTARATPGSPASIL